MGKIPFYIESKNGHDTEQVPDDEIQERVEEELEKDKWVTVEKKDGTSEILTKDDIPTKSPSAETNTDEPTTPESTPAKPGKDQEEPDPKENSNPHLEDKTAWKNTFAKEKATPLATVTKKSTSVTTKKKWEDKFTSVTSATATHKAKGG